MAWTASRVRYDDIVRLQEALGCSEPMAWILTRRGLADPADARAFLDAGDPTTPLAPPEAIPGVAEVADRLADAVRRGERIVVHGDYDCDGITSTALLVQALRTRGARVRSFLPSRFTDGYGVSVATVERLAEEGCDLLVCVDCGTTAVEALTRAVEVGIASVVCDHHLAAGARPPAIIANPALGRGEAALPAAAGVVFAVTRALAARLDGDRLAPDPEEGIDLVALATVADAVPLVGENRRLVARGLAAMRTSPRVGIAALCRVAGVAPRALVARHLGFTLAPSLNAAGRIAHADRGLDLLLSDSPDAADAIARELWDLNISRRDLERRILAEAVEMVEAAPPEERSADAIVVAGDDWHEGVVGIVAARLVDRFRSPAIVLSRSGERAKGSGRSLPGVDLHGLVSGASERLLRWGGHAGAVGLELASEHIAEFRRSLAQQAVGARSAIARARIRSVDVVVTAADLSLGQAEELEALAPFGRGNPEVLMAVPGARVLGMTHRGEGNRHLELRLRAGGVNTRAIGFGLGHRAPDIDQDAPHDAIVRLSVDRFQDLVSPQVVVEAIEEVTAEPRPPGLCVQACDAHCPDRVTITAGLLLHGRQAPPGPAPGGPPRGIRDRRGRGGAVALMAALSRADGGAVAIVSDVALRRSAFEDALAPGRLEADGAALCGLRCAPDAARRRLAAARGGSTVAFVEYAALPEVELPGGAHVVLLDPPADADQAAWALARAAGRWVHLVWGAEEVEVARRVVDERLDVRAAAAVPWRALGEGAAAAYGAELDQAAMGDGPAAVPAAVAAVGLASLAEIGLVEIDERGVRGTPAADRRRLSDSHKAQRAAGLRAAQHAFLDRAMSLDLSAPQAVMATAG